MATEARQPAALVLDELPPWALARVLSQAPLSFADLARVACVSTSAPRRATRSFCSGAVCA